MAVSEVHSHPGRDGGGDEEDLEKGGEEMIRRRKLAMP